MASGYQASEMAEVMPIAVTGMAFRGPGDATSVEKLWDMVFEKREAWSLVPKQKWNNEAFYHPDANRNGTSNVKGGHYFTDDISKFDATFFNMTKVEAEALDPQQRLLLECCYETLENSGTPLEKAAGTDTSVYVGSFCGDYTDLLMRDTENIPLYQATSSGNSRAIIANRLSYFFDFRGPSVTIDTACSASLVALHLACQSLRTGESHQALVAGANVILSPDMTISMSMMRFLSPDGRCYTFDDRANGYARGEGVGCILLKPLDDALRDGDAIRGIIRNTGVNQDGKTPGITLPSRKAQEDLIQAVYDRAGLDPLETSYVECHGTGTPAGDPLETAAISHVMGRSRSHEQPLHIGSIKTNIGHLEGASGIAGVIKTILMLEKQTILPNRNFANANKQIPLYDWKLNVPTDPEPWKSHHSLRASINSFGYGGTNAHAILEDARSYITSRKIQRYVSKDSGALNFPLDVRANDHGPSATYPGDFGNVEANGVVNGHSEAQTKESDSTKASVDGTAVGQKCPERSSRVRLYILSSFDIKGGRNQAESLSKYLENRLHCAEDEFMNNLAYTLGERRSRFDYKAVIAAKSVSQLIERLQNRKLPFVGSPGKKILAYVFTGQGAQWYAMGRELMWTYPVFHKSLVRASIWLNTLGAPWNLIDELSRSFDTSQVGSVHLSQPLCTALQLALVELLGSWDIRPTAVTGHSSGEIAAAYTVGALTFEDAMAVAYYRGVVSSIAKTKKSRGAMIAVGMTPEDAIPTIAGLTQGRATVACINSPTSVTISGDLSAITELEETLKAKALFARKLDVEVAYHSHHMENVAQDYLTALSEVKAQPVKTDIEFFSSVTGKRAEPSELGPSYWVKNLVGQVKFAESLRNLCTETSRRSTRLRRRGRDSVIDTLVEIGPHSALAGPIKQILQAEPKLKDSSPTYRTALVRKVDAVETCLALASDLLTEGYAVNIAGCNRPESTETPQVLTDLPHYVWNHSTSYWAESRISKAYRFRPHARTDILGFPEVSANSPRPSWRNCIRATEIPWIKDHRVQDSVVYPAAGYLVMAIEAASQRAMARNVNVAGYKLREVTFGQALVLLEQSEEIETIVQLKPHQEGTRLPSDTWDDFCVISVTHDDRWTEHCRGLISVERNKTKNVIGQVGQQTANHTPQTSYMETLCQTQIDTKELYNQLDGLGLHYGPSFTNMESARSGPNMSISTVKIPDTAAAMPMGFQYPTIIHPATADSLFHGMFAALASDSVSLKDPLVPVFVGEVSVSSQISHVPGDILVSYASVEKKDSRHVKANMIVLGQGSKSEEPVITIHGLTCTALANDTQDQMSSRSNQQAYYFDWKTDVDFMSSGEMIRICNDIRPLPNEQETVRSLERAGFYFMEDALKNLDPDKIRNMTPYHRLQCACFESFVSTVRHGRLGIPTASWVTANEVERAEHISQVSATGAEGALLCQVGKNLSRILTGQVEALTVMVEEGRLDAYYRENARFDRNYRAATKYFDLLAHKNPHLNVLEIGAGTGGATLPIMETIGGKDAELSRLSNWHFTDISSSFFDAAKEKLNRWSHLISYAKLDIEADPLKQGFEAESYDVVVAANVLHATKSMHQTLGNVRKLLKPGGRLVLIELTRERMTTSTIFGTLPGWWAGAEDGRQKGPTLTEDEWHQTLQQVGFSGLDTVVWDSSTEPEHQGSMMVSRVIENGLVAQKPGVLLIHDASLPWNIRKHMVTRLSNECATTVDTQTLVNADPAGKLCIVLVESSKPFLSDPLPEEFEATKRLFTTAAGVMWVTRGAKLSCRSPASSLITGFTRTVRSEYGSIRIVVFDLDPDQPFPSVASGDAVVDLFKGKFGANSQHLDNPDLEYVQRSGNTMIPRIVSHATVNRKISSLDSQPMPELQSFRQSARPLVMEIGTPGLLDTIHFVDDDRMTSALPDDQVEIEVKATGFNFKDVMMAMGQVEVEELGLECAGIVTSRGRSINHVSIGDRVSCFAFGAFSTKYRSDAIFVQKLPNDMSFETAACLPVIYCTAYHSVYNIANVQKGETVLIHAASGGLGQAAIELCRLVGAEIFATVGTREKKALLMERFSIPEDHILFSRDDSFAKAIMTMTNGIGVDVILNSVAGEMLRITWECIAPFGRFIELGARDYTINTHLEMHKFARNVTFAVVNLVSLVKERPQAAARVWLQVMDLFRTKRLNGPSPITVYGISEIEKALRIMQTGKHMGKLVAVARADETVKIIPRAKTGSILSSDASYLLIGGLGGLGRSTALWMADHGARNLIFASRSGIAKQDARELVKILKERQITVAVHRGDVSNVSQLKSVLAQTNHMPPIRGVIQGAMVLQDSLLEKMTAVDYAAAIRPKVHGTWNLHDLLPKDMDFFVMLSSTSGIIGNASQANYAAGSTFLDAFCDYRRALGLPAVTIDLGVILGVGYVAENQDLASKLDRQGFEGTTEEELMQLIKIAITSPPKASSSGQIVTGLGTWSETSHGAFASPIFSHFRRMALTAEQDAEKTIQAGRPVRDLLRKVKSLDEATHHICESIIAKVSSLSMIPVEEISETKPISVYGMDSLVAVEMRNWLFKEMDATIPILELLANQPIVSLAAKIAKGCKLIDLSTTKNGEDQA